MIKAYTAYTHEVDDVDQAVAELMDRLGEPQLLKNSVGIISCYAEYVDSGVVKALCDQLPFETAGTTTVVNATGSDIGETMLTLTVLTSDDIVFAAGLTEPIPAETEEPIRAGYERTAARLPGRPSMMFSFAPLLLNVGGDFYVNTLDKVSGGVPSFGTLAVDHNEDYSQSRVIFNGQAYRDRYAMILLYGDVNPTYYVGAISEEKVFSEKGVVTASQGNQLQTVNGAPMIEYLLSIGLTKNAEGGISGINSFPIIVDYNDGTTPVARAMFALTPEGYAVCGGDIPVGATLAIGEFDPLEIQNTTRWTLQTALEQSKKSVFLMYSCIGRYLSQGANQMAETEIVRDLMAGSGIPYAFAYSGGEFCPVYGRDARLSNRNHNNTFIICALS